MRLYLRYIKKNKMNTITMFLSIAMTVSLIISMLSIRYTDENLNRSVSRYTTNVYDITFNDINQEQATNLAYNDNIEHLGLYKVTGTVKAQSGISLPIVAGNQDYILRQSLLEDGRIPKNETELISERWVLKNLGFKAEVGTKIKLKTKNSLGKIQKKTYTLVGILSDNPYNKLNGMLEVYTVLNRDTEGKELYASIKFYDGTDGKEALKKVLKNGEFTKEQLNNSGDAFELLDNSYHLGKEDFAIITVLFLISSIINYGVYRISIMDRRKEYGIIQANGIKNKSLFLLLLKEMGIIYLGASIVGIVLGIIFSYCVNIISESIHTVFVFWGKEYYFSLEIPWIHIGISLLFMGISILFIVWISYRKLKKETVIQKLKEEIYLNTKYHILNIFDGENRILVALKLALKNIIRDWKSVISIVLSIGIASALGLGLEYESSFEKGLEEEKYNVENLDGNFRLEEYNDLTTITGISDTVVKEIQELKGVSTIETSMIMPSRLIKDPDIRGNTEYFESVNRSLEDTFYKSISGQDGKEYVYKNTLKGFNKNALKKLKSYVIDGNYNIKKLVGNKAILFMPQVDKNKGGLGFIKNGEPVMDYKVGDTITIKFRQDLDVSSKKYWELKDNINKYRYFTFKIIAIVYYPYMAETSSIGSLTPDIIISEEQFRDLTGINVYSVVNINTNEEYKNMEELEEQILSISKKDRGISTRNLTDEKNNKRNMSLRDTVYRYGIEIFVFIIAIFNMINTIRYRFFLRKKEFSLYKVMGIGEKRIRKIVVLEGLIYGLLSFLVSCIGYMGFICWFYSRNKTYYKVYNIDGNIEVKKVFFVLAINIVICVFISIRELKRIKRIEMIEEI